MDHRGQVREGQADLLQSLLRSKIIIRGFMDKVRSATLGLLYAIRDVAIDNRDKAAGLFGLDSSEIDLILSISHEEMELLAANLTPGFVLKVSPSLVKGSSSPLARLLTVTKVIR